MAKKKITKKPVSKRIAKTPRTTRATLNERNERLGTSNAPKTRKPRSTKIKQDGVEVTITEGPATQWVSGNVDEFFDTADGHIVQQTPSWVSSQEVDTEVKTEVPTEVQTSGSIFIANYPGQKIEFTKVHKTPSFMNECIQNVRDSWNSLCKTFKSGNPMQIAEDLVMNHPLVLTTIILVGASALALGTLLFMRWAHI